MHFLAIIFLFLGYQAHASRDQSFGLGGSTSGRVGGVTADPENPFAAIYNPGLLSAGNRSYFVFSTGASAAHYRPLQAVLIDSPEFRTETGVAKIQDYRPPSVGYGVWALGFSHPFYFPSLFSRRAGLGLTLSGPFNWLRTFQSLTPYDFAGLHYGTSDAQFKGTVSLGLELWPEHFHAGAGVSFFISSAGAAEATVIAENPTGRFALDVGLNAAMVVGLFGQWEPLSTSLVYRQEIAPSFEQRLTAKAQVGGPDTLAQPLLFRSTLYYEPHTFEAEAQYDFGPVVASAGVSYQLWSQYKPSYLSAETVDSTGRVRTTMLPGIPFRNTVSPRMSMEVPLLRRQLAVAWGYQFRPTPVADLSGPGNILDANTHVAGLSLRHRVGAGELIPWTFTWGLFAQYHWVGPRRVEKADMRYVGAPGYEISGQAYTYGLSLQADL